jgi:hypothetical protein
VSEITFAAKKPHADMLVYAEWDTLPRCNLVEMAAGPKPSNSRLYWSSFRRALELQTSGLPRRGRRGSPQRHSSLPAGDGTGSQQLSVNSAASKGVPGTF